MYKQDVDRNRPTLHAKAGEKIEFPVAADHPLARVQTLTPVRSADDVHDFLTLWSQYTSEEEKKWRDPATLLEWIMKAELKVLRLFSNDLLIEKGAVVTLNNPLNKLEYDNVTIEGDLVVRGDLILKCNTLTVK